MYLTEIKEFHGGAEGWEQKNIKALAGPMLCQTRGTQTKKEVQLEV